jgi:queuine tRNA-ribosyltransferase
MGPVLRVVARDAATGARAGEFVTAHGVVRTPAFMPVGTAASVKGLAPWELERLAPEIVLANTYHLLLRPGLETIGATGGLHAFMGWRGPILTDSGGFQVYSLADRRRFDDDGVTFRSHVDGRELRLTPESCVGAQARLGVDVAMALDVCPALPAERDELERAVAVTSRWAARCRQALPPGGDTLRFGIVQGGARPRAAAPVGRGNHGDGLRRSCARRLLGR